ncbi:MAG: elongation factor P, partial [Alphaproteobacteria bacterium]
KLNERFRASETVERARLEQVDYQFLYADGDEYTFMQNETYEQITLGVDFIGEDTAKFLQDGMKVQVEAFEDTPIGV